MQEKFSSANELVDHLFRHEAGKMVAVLTRIFGMHNLEMAEDVVQEAFLKAAQTWKFNMLPENPAAWLMQVAKNKALDIIRREQRFNHLSAEVSAQLQLETDNTIEQFFLDTEIADSQLQLIFACCHPSLKEEDQVALTLKTISGFSVAEIAKALLAQESAVQKRYTVQNNLSAVKIYNLKFLLAKTFNQGLILFTQYCTSSLMKVIILQKQVN